MRKPRLSESEVGQLSSADRALLASLNEQMASLARHVATLAERIGAEIRRHDDDRAEIRKWRDELHQELKRHDRRITRLESSAPNRDDIVSMQKRHAWLIGAGAAVVAISGLAGSVAAFIMIWSGGGG